SRAISTCEAGSHTLSPLVSGRTRRTGMSPGRTLVPDGCGGTPAVHDACTAGRTMTARAASVCGVGGGNTGEDGEKGADQKRSHLCRLSVARSSFDAAV